MVKSLLEIIGQAGRFWWIKNIGLYKEILNIEHLSLIESADDLTQKVMSYITKNYPEKKP